MVDFTAGAPKPFPLLLAAAHDAPGRSGFTVQAPQCTKGGGGVLVTRRLRRRRAMHAPLPTMQPGGTMDLTEPLLLQKCDAADLYI